MEIEELVELGRKHYYFEENNPKYQSNIVWFHKRVLDSTKEETKELLRLSHIADCEYYSYLMLIGFGADYIQEPLRNRQTPNEFIQNVIENLDGFLLKTKRTQADVLYRQDNYSDIEKYSAGQLIRFDNYLVTSIDNFDNTYNIVWVITPQKAKSRGHEGYLIYDHGNELQVTFERGTTFRIDKIETGDEKNYIHITEMKK